jgi:non-canonical poly(A) RNA polymerase PAPD5/7
MSDYHNGLECVGLVKKYLKENELIEPIILVLKQLLKCSAFNDPYSGGLSSYSLFLMIVSYLQLQNIP